MKASRNKYMKERRAKLRAEGLCVDCQKRKVHANKKTKKQHVLCKICLAVRTTRLEASKARVQFPLAGASR